MDVQMQQEEFVAPEQSRKLRRVASPRKSFTSLLSSGSPTSPASAGLDNLLRDGAGQKHARRTVTPSPFRFALTTCKELFNPKSSNSQPPSPTRIHKPAYPAQIPSDLSIPQTPTAEQYTFSVDRLIEEPRLSPFDIPVILEQIV